MITVQFSDADFAQIRFIHSPLVELVMSWHVLHRDDFYALYRHWVDQAAPTVRGVPYPYMAALLVPGVISAQLLITPPPRPERAFAESIARLRATPDEVIRRSVRQVIEMVPRTPPHDHLLADPRAALECLIAELIDYWGRTLAGHWTAIRAAIDSATLQAGRQLAIDGAGALLGGLYSGAAFTDGLLTLPKHAPPLMAGHLDLGGQGALLAPAVFKQGISAHAFPHTTPLIVYTAPGAGVWQTAPRLAMPDSLRLLIGESKARVLMALIESDLHSGEIARRLDLSPAAVSQQLQGLFQIGLVETARVGKYVCYRLSARGSRLLTLFDE